MRLTDPDFTFPSGKTLEEMEAFHRQWELDHAEPVVDQSEARRLRVVRGEADPSLDDVDGYAARMAAERPTCWCPLCGGGLVEL